MFPHSFTESSTVDMMVREPSSGQRSISEGESGVRSPPAQLPQPETELSAGPGLVSGMC